jgi:hypothetical protein
MATNNGWKRVSVYFTKDFRGRIVREELNISPHRHQFR